MRKFEAKNINCQSCANTIINVLEDDFGKIEVDVEKKIVSLDISDDKKEQFYKEMQDLGFEIVKEVE